MELGSNDLATLRQSPWMGNSSRTSTNTILTVFTHLLLKAFIYLFSFYEKLTTSPKLSLRVKVRDSIPNQFKATTFMIQTTEM